MPNGTYGGVRGTETKVGQRTFVSRPTRLILQLLNKLNYQIMSKGTHFLGQPILNQLLNPSLIPKIIFNDFCPI